jgi:hypothetical protein
VVQSIAIGWFLGADPRSTAVGIGVVMVQACAGVTCAWRLLGVGEPLRPEAVGLGLLAPIVVLGTLVIAGGHRLPWLSIAIPLAVLVALGVPTPVRHRWPRWTDEMSAWIILLTPIMGMTPWSWHLAVLAAPPWIAAAWARRTFRHLDSLTLGVGLLVGLIGLSGALRPRSPSWIVNMVSNDILQDEAISRGLMSWGLSENLGLVGHPIRYHVLSHAWVGQITNDLGLAAFVGHLVLQPMVAYCIIGCLIGALTLRIGAAQPAVLGALLMVFAQATPTEALFPVEFLKTSMTLGTATALATMLLWIRHHETPRLGPTILLASASFAATATKFHFGIIVLGGAILAELGLGGRLIHRAVRVLSMTGGVGIAWLIFFRQSGGMAGVFDPYAALSWSSVNVMTGIALLLLTRIPISWQKGIDRTTSEGLFRCVALAAVAVFVALSVATSEEAAGKNYAITFAFVAAAPVIGPTIWEGWRCATTRTRSMVLVWGALTGLGTTVAFEVLKWHAYSSGPRATLRNVVLDVRGSSLAILGLIGTGIALLSLLSGHRLNRHDGWRLASLMVVAVATASSSVKVMREPINDIAYGDLPEEHVEAGYVAEGFEQLVQWIQTRTAESSVLATTSACLARTTAGDRCYVESCADWRIGALALSGRAGRRIYLEAPSYMSDTSDTGLLGGDIERRYLTLRQARLGDTNAAISALRAEGVAYLVVDVRFPLAELPRTARIVFRNDGFEVLAL